MVKESSSGYRGLSAFYFFYFVILGAFLPYWTLFLKEEGMSASNIGSLMAIMMITKIFSPFLWGKLADEIGKRLLVIRLGSIFIIVTFVNIFWANNFWQIALVMFGFSFFWNAVLPQFETLTLETLGDRSHKYSQIRVWGSIGFIFAVVAAGGILELVEMSYLPVILLVCMLILIIVSFCVSSPEKKTQMDTTNTLGKVLFSRPVMILFLLCFLMQFSHGPYYTFFSIYLEQLGYSKTSIGLLWSLGVLAEIGLFIIMPTVLGSFSIKKILVACLFIASCRWYIIGEFAEQSGLLLFAQCLHAITYASFHAAAINLVNRQFAGSHAGQGQALYSSVSFGLGGGCGAFIFGLVWENLGGPSSFVIASLSVLLGAFAGIVLLKNDSFEQTIPYTGSNTD